jgi:hypothetical protein
MAAWTPAPAHYTIRINGYLGATVLSAFPALAPHHHGAHTVLTGLLDRSALYGVLAEIEALGLDLLEIRKLTPDRESPVPRSPPLTVTATTVGSARSLLAEGEALMTSAPVRDPLADHLIIPQNATCTPPSNTATRSRMPGPGEPTNRLDQVTNAHLGGRGAGAARPVSQGSFLRCMRRWACQGWAACANAACRLAWMARGTRTYPR